MAELQVNIVTPNGLVYENTAYLVDVKTINGGLSILPDHTPIIVPLAIDVVRIKQTKESTAEDFVVVNGGIMEVRDNIVSILADSAENPEDIDITRAESAKQRAEEKLAQAQESESIIDVARAQDALSRATNRLKVKK